MNILDKLGLKAPAKKIAIAVGLHETKEHGHEFMVVEIERRAARGDNLVGKTLIEIGTTREELPGLGSTEILARLCKKHKMRMITVDMDNENTERARRKMHGFGDSFIAICQKGEEFLQSFNDTVDFIYLDAFDFEHPNHSAKRKLKYESLLGTTINNDACHKMHLDCAVQIVRLSERGTAVVFDDVWSEHSIWKGKGETAIPYLFQNAFKVIDSGKNSAILIRT